MTIKWNENISSGTTMTIGWTVGAAMDATWYFFPAFLVGYVLVAALCDLILTEWNKDAAGRSTR